MAATTQVRLLVRTCIAGTHGLTLLQGAAPPSPQKEASGSISKTLLVDICENRGICEHNWVFQLISEERIRGRLRVIVRLIVDSSSRCAHGSLMSARVCERSGWQIILGERQ